MPGPAPKPASKRRRRTPPASYGLAEPITAPAAPVSDRGELGLEDPHPLIVRMWEALQTSAEARFYSQADWQRAAWEMWHANALLTSDKPIPAASWAQVQRGLGDLLVSPAEKRRVGVEIVPAGPDPDADAAVAMAARYAAKLQVVKPE